VSAPLLLDASVWLAALDRDDRFHVPARQLLGAAASAAPTLAALDLTLYEVANVAVVRWHSRADAARLVTLVLRACPDTLEKVDEELLAEAAAIASRNGLTVHDGAYVAVGRRREWTLVSGDIGDLVEPGFAVSPETAVTGPQLMLNMAAGKNKKGDAWMTGRRIGTPEEWAAAREELLAREKEHTRLGDELARQRRELPWVRVDKEYRFDTDDGARSLQELFEGRSQLVVYHFMFGPSYEAGCPTCSSIADAVDGVVPHLNARDVTVLFVSQAPLEKLQAYKRRMGWSFPWVSSANSEFNLDLGYSSSEEQTREWAVPLLEVLPPIADRNAGASGTDVVGYLTQSQGFSSFVLDDGAVYHTYSTGGRGVEFLMGYYGILDRTPKGRDEGDGFQLWIRRRDEY
jgi:predicted dithiol-disulfide oxidoreductase (DUF899 family)/predicted nucleic acid-binding protein